MIGVTVGGAFAVGRDHGACSRVVGWVVFGCAKGPTLVGGAFR